VAQIKEIFSVWMYLKCCDWRFKQFVLFICYIFVELTEDKQGTSESDAVCKCNSEAGYVPVNTTKLFGQLSKAECSILHTASLNQTGLCFCCHQQVLTVQHVYVCAHWLPILTTLVV